MDSLDAKSVVALIVQLGSFGLLAYFVAFQLPKVLTRFAATVEQQTRTAADMQQKLLTTFSNQERENREAWKAEARAEREQCRNDHEKIMDAVAGVYEAVKSNGPKRRGGGAT